jgi:hypothetical protein
MGRISSRRTFTILSVFAILFVLGVAASVYVTLLQRYEVAGEAGPHDGPTALESLPPDRSLPDQWFQITLRLRDIESKYRKHEISKKEYITEKSSLTQDQQRLYNQFPQTIEEYEMQQGREADEEKRISEPRTKTETPVPEPQKGKSQSSFWLSVVSTIVGALGTISTVLLSWRNDRRLAIDAQLKLLQLQEPT